MKRERDLKQEENIDCLENIFVDFNESLKY